MSITAVTFARIADVVRVFATSNLVAPTLHWYLDGAWVGGSSASFRDFRLGPNEQAHVDVLDTTSSSFDPIASAPAGYPARRSLWWVRSADVDVAHYLVEQKVGAGSYAQVATVPQREEAWALGWLTDRLDDLASYTWRITAYDRAGNAGTARTIGPEKIVRRPNAPAWSFTFNGTTDRVTIGAA